jgi:hypothetical protein
MFFLFLEEEVEKNEKFTETSHGENNTNNPMKEDRNVIWWRLPVSWGRKGLLSLPYFLVSKFSTQK